MTRRRLLRSFSTRDTSLQDGELVVLLDGEGTEGGHPQAGYQHVMVKTRHGRKVRVPRALLGTEVVEFHCQLCSRPALPSFRDYVDHVISRHLREQLLRGLDMSRKQPACPFPSCAGMSWPVVEDLLYHYASHHHVLEKVLLFETEVVSEELRQEVRARDEVILGLGRENEQLREKVGYSEESSLQAVKDKLMQKTEEGAKVREASGTQRRARRREGESEAASQKEAVTQKEAATMKRLGSQEIRTLELALQAKTDEVVALVKEASRSSLEQSLMVGSLEAKVERLREELAARDTPTSSPTITSTGEVPVTLAKVRCYEDSDQGAGRELGELGLAETLKKKNFKLKMEIQNVKQQNEKLHGIIKMGNSAVETSKNIGKDLARENTAMKEREKETSSDLARIEKSLSVLAEENERLNVKYRQLQERRGGREPPEKDGRRQEQPEEVQLRAELAKKDGDMLAEKRKLAEQASRHHGEVKSLVEMRDEARGKLSKLRATVRQMDEAKRSMEADYKKLIAENKAAAGEIRSLKSHLGSNRSLLSDRSEVSQELVVVKQELVAKTAKLEVAEKKVRSLVVELSGLGQEAREAREGCRKAEGLAARLGREVEGLKENLGLRTAEVAAARTGEENLRERVDFYIGQCTEFEAKDGKYREEIVQLQQGAMEAKAALEELRAALEASEEGVVFYRDQEEVLVDEIEKLKAAVMAAKENSEEDKISLQRRLQEAALVEELYSSQELLMARIRRKDWEIENYQRRLDVVFGAGFSGLAPCTYLAPQQEQQEEVALDLSLASTSTEEHLLRDVKVEPGATVANRPFVGGKRKRSESSTAEEETATGTEASLEETATEEDAFTATEDTLNATEEEAVTSPFHETSWGSSTVSPSRCS